MESSELDLTSLTADIVSAYVAHNALTGDKLPDLIGSVYGALSRASVQGVEPEKVELKPAVAIKKSVTPEYIICLEDGQKFKSLKRHLKTHYDMSPGRIPGEVGAAARLSDGRSELCRCAF